MWGWAITVLLAGMAPGDGAASDAPSPVPQVGVLNPALRHYGVGEGLPASEVLALAQHPDQALWIGTSAGLARYDGVEMRIWRHDPERSEGLPGISVDALAVDRGGRVWIASRDLGVSVYDGRHYTRLGPRPGATHAWAVADVWSLTPLDDGSVLAGTYRAGLWRLAADRAPQRLQWSESAGIAPEALTVADVLVRDGELWIASVGSGLLRADRDGRRIERVGPEDWAEATISAITLDAERRIWFAALGRGVGRIAEDGSFATMLDWRPELGVISVLLCDRRGSVWGGALRGLIEWRPDGAVIGYPPRPGTAAGVPRSRILTGLVDHEGGLWWGSDADGLAYLRPNWRAGRWLDVGTGAEARLRGIRGGLVEPGPGADFWFGARDGVLQRFRLEDGAVVDVVLVPGEPSPSRPEGIRALHQRADGRLWVAHRRGLSVLDAAGRVLDYWPLDAKAPAPAALASLIWSDGPDTWVAVDDDALYRFGTEGRTVRAFRTEDGWDATQVESVAATEGGFWLASERGVYRYDRLRERFQALAALPGQRYDALYDDGRALWAHRPGRVVRIERGSERIALELGTESGLPVMVAAGWLADRRGRLWLVGNGGLVRIDPDDLSLRTFGPADGLPSPELGTQPPRLDASGRLWAQAERGPLVIDLDELGWVSTVAPNLIDIELRYRFADREYVVLPGDTPIALPYAHQELSVSARLMSFLEPTGNRYEYRYTVDAQEERSILPQSRYTFGRLPPGVQSIGVRAHNSAGLWAPQEARFRLLVAPPPWRSAPALAAYLVLGLSGLALAFALYRRRLLARHRLAWIERDAEHQRALIRAKTESITFLSHDLRNLLAAQVQLLDPLRREATGSIAVRLARLEAGMRRMHHLLRDVVDQARLEAGTLEIRATVVHLGDWLEDVLAVHRETAQARGLALELEGALPTLYWQVDPRRLGQILDNLLGNALKFARRGPIRIEFAQRDGRLGIAVLDDGPGPDGAADPAALGRNAAESGSGLGLSFCRALLERMDGRLSLGRRAAGGTRAEVELAARPRPDAEQRLLIFGGGRSRGPASPLEQRRVETLVEALRVLEHWRPDRILLLDPDATDSIDVVTLLRARGYFGPIDRHRHAGAAPGVHPGSTVTSASMSSPNAASSRAGSAQH